MVTAPQLRSIDVLGALSLAGDMAMGLRAGHGVRATYIGMHIADRLGLTPAQRVDLFYAELLMDAGCTAWASQTAAAILSDDIAARRQFYFLTDPSDPRDLLRWLAGYMAAGERLDRRLRRSIDFAVHGREFMLEALRNTAETAARLARRLDRPPGVQEGLRFAFEQWDGGGPYERRADTIPLVSRIVYATVFLEVIHQLSGREAALQLGRGRRGKTLDPAIVDAFLSVSADSDFWRGLEDEAVWDVVRTMEPDSPYRYVDSHNLDDAARAFADFADLKSFFTAGHSRRVADLAERIAVSLNLPPEEVVTIHRAALLHDIGLVAVPSFVLHKPAARLAEAEWESLRLHPYYSQRILARVPVFGAASELAAAHHERPDGEGYPRGLRGEQIPLGARVLAVADAFDELAHNGPDGPGLEVGPSLDVVVRGVDSRFDRDVVEALRKLLDVSALTLMAPPVRRDWPAGLTDREVEVLRLLATGASRRDMAQRLTVSEHTIRHHLEHIYAKLDVRTRVEATLFALEHNLIA
jgi:HD-GYP domain-containing protein (c-di-GMP phosphodiesterase class II)/DNA-binding CsgD family transcriptional regulator